MPFEHNTAADYRDLLARLRLFVSQHGWTVKRWIESDNNAESELILQGAGISGQDQIFVGIQTYSDTGQDYFNWQLQGMVGFAEAYPFSLQPGVIAEEPPSIALWNKPIPYWLVVNAQRIILVAKVSTAYMGLYLGFLKVYGTPGQYPYPLLVGGSLTQNKQNPGTINFRWSNHSAEQRCFIDPGYNNNNTASTLYLRKPGGFWQAFANRHNDERRIYYGEHYQHVWPTVNDSAEKLRQGLHGEHPLYPLVLYERPNQRANTAQNVWGELDGCFFVSGFGLAAEDTLLVNNHTFLVVPNIHRNQINDYWALRLD